MVPSALTFSREERQAVENAEEEKAEDASGGGLGADDRAGSRGPEEGV